MIAVIADDLTGAAELGGIGLRHGLSVAVSTVAPFSVEVELLIIAADTRSMGEDAAVAEMDRITRELGRLRPEWIYKKVDSVLRGHVVAEIRAQLKVLGLERALLVPANPMLGRTIVNGLYYFNGLPVHESSFSADPEFAIRSSDLQDMLHSRQAPVAIRKAREVLPERGIIVGEVAEGKDLNDWAARIDEGMLLAGASGFFNAVLHARKDGSGSAPGGGGPGNEKRMLAAFGSPILFVSGTTFDRNRAMIRDIKIAGGPVNYIPAATGGSVEDAEESYQRWSKETMGSLQHSGKAIIAIGEEGPGEPGRDARLLKDHMSSMVRRLLQEVSIRELVIEGGATAYGILELAGLRTFFPEEELAPGVIRMRAGELPSLHVTVKPGSYDWPESIRRRFKY